MYGFSLFISLDKRKPQPLHESTFKITRPLCNSPHTIQDKQPYYTNIVRWAWIQWCRCWDLNLRHPAQALNTDSPTLGAKESQAPQPKCSTTKVLALYKKNQIIKFKILHLFYFNDTCQKHQHHYCIHCYNIRTIILKCEAIEWVPTVLEI